MEKMTDRKITSNNLYIVLKAVDDEPEFPDEMPDKMWKELENCSREELSIAFKICIKLAKVDISNRIKERLLPKPPAKK